MVAFKQAFGNVFRDRPAAPARNRRADASGSPVPFMRLAGLADRDGSTPDAGVAGRIDRRAHPRQPLSLRVAGRRLDHTVEARREPTLNFLMNDVSAGGLCATSQTPLKVGERVAVFFPPLGAGRGWDAYGRILRVQPERQGYRIAVSFDPLRAA